MEVTHRSQNLKIAPRKLRLVIDQFRHMPALKALDVLPLVTNKGAGLAFKSLHSAVQVAKDRDLQPESLVIQRIWADEGMRLKRMIMGGRGRSSSIRKHYSHLSIVLSGEPAARRSRRAAKPAAEPAEQSTTPTE